MRFCAAIAFDEVVVALPPDLAANPPSYLDAVIARRGRRAPAGFGRERVRARSAPELAGDRASTMPRGRS